MLVSIGHIGLMKVHDFAYKKTGISIADYKMKMFSAVAYCPECDAEGGARLKP